MFCPEFSRADIGVDQKAHWRETWPIGKGARIRFRAPLDSSPSSWEDTKSLDSLASRTADVMFI